jgi:formylglycine-generating enzyme required for sulfatase activity
VRIAAPFYLGKYEVSRDQWRAILGSDPSRAKGQDRPVESASWKEAAAFLRALSDRIRARAPGSREPRFELRLPTEAEWEYACRAGTGTRFSAGGSTAGLVRAGWFSGNAEGQSRVPGKKAPNAWGLYDMHGNVREWCLDLEHGSYEGAPADGSAWFLRPRSAKRVARGGSWGDPEAQTRSAARAFLTSETRDPRTGLRACLVFTGKRQTAAGRARTGSASTKRLDALGGKTAEKA